MINDFTWYAYDLGGQLERMYNSSYTYLDNVAYDRFGAKVSQTYGNGIATDYSYNNVTRRLTGITTLNGNSPLSSFAYTYDPVGNVTQVNSVYNHFPGMFFEDFYYDAADQLTAACEYNNRAYAMTAIYGDYGKIDYYRMSDEMHDISYTCSYPSSRFSPELESTQTPFAPVRSDYAPGSDYPHAQTAIHTYGINGSLKSKEMPASSEHYRHVSSGTLKAYSRNPSSYLCTTSGTASQFCKLYFCFHIYPNCFLRDSVLYSHHPELQLSALLRQK